MYFFLMLGPERKSLAMSLGSSLTNLKAMLRHMSTGPGVYKMLSAQEKLLYVGKAANIKSRVSSYFREVGLSPKNKALVAKIDSIETINTSNESEALLLEQNIIKAERPPYNVLLRDDKSYPFIALSKADSFPRLWLHRGKKQKSVTYFGPYPNANAVRTALTLLQKVFKVRQCEDSYYKNRTRPCLQYQIGRCKAPCVDYVDEQEYAEDVHNSLQFLQGKSNDLLETLQLQMDAASKTLAYETAAAVRDQIIQLRKVQTEQTVWVSKGQSDVVGLACEHQVWCVVILFIRQGQMLGSQAYYPKSASEETEEALLSGFLAQFYLQFAGLRDFPDEIILPIAVFDKKLLEQTISEVSGKIVTLKQQVRGNRKQWLDMAARNAKISLSGWLSGQQSMQKRFKQVGKLLKMSQQPERIECFDVSHLQGEGTVAACVVFDHSGPVKKDYRRYNIKGVTLGDDYAAMAQALKRRYVSVHQGEQLLPDILLIDGGKGQLSVAVKVLGASNAIDLPIVGLAKGFARKAEFDQLLDGRTGQTIKTSSGERGLILLQQIRDEAHRFALTGNRARINKSRKRSVLEDIPGIGQSKRSLLLRHFGGMQALKSASVLDIAKTPGISHTLAQSVWSFLHE